MDSHRPYHLSNVYAPTIFLLGTERQEDMPPKPVAVGEEEEEEEEENSDDESLNAAVNRRRERAMAAAQRVEDEATAREYYKSSYYTTAISMLTYKLASSLHRASSDLLWLAIVGFTDQMIHGRIDSRRYRMEVEAWKPEVRQLAGNADVSQYLERRSGQATPAIRVSEEFRFIGYRHWTLYDSMYHSPYIAARLGVWQSQRGQEQLKKMLATMGLPLHECKQPYALMNITIKRSLSEKVFNYAKDFGLEDIAFTSFIKTDGVTRQLSAVDAAFSVTGLLEERASVRRDEDTGTVDENAWKANFNKAYDSLSGSAAAWEKLMEGMESAISLQKAIVRQGASLVENKSVVHTGPFRYAFLLRHAADASLFTNPLALSKLGLFLQDVFEQMKKPTKSLVVGAYNELTDTVLIVGVPSSPGHNNSFGINFEQAAIETQARIQLHTFDASIIELDHAHLDPFIECLHTGMMY